MFIYTLKSKITINNMRYQNDVVKMIYFYFCKTDFVGPVQPRFGDLIYWV